jgi:hypothetical protein
VDVGAAVVADEQALEVVEPGEAALDDPAVAAEPGAVSGLAARDHRFDPSLPELAAVLVVVVAAVGNQLVRAAAWPTAAAAHRRHPLQQRQQLRDVVAVATAQRPGERDAIWVDEQLVLRAAAAAVDRARTGRAAPFFACT